MDTTTMLKDDTHFAVDLTANPSDDGSASASNIAWFLAGTRIATPDGQRDVATFPTEGQVLSLSGATLNVTSVTYRAIDAVSQPHPETVWPVRVCRDAFGAGRPASDVLVAPELRVRLPGGSIPIRFLINGASIARVPMDRFICYALSLERPAILSADGIAVAVGYEAERAAWLPQLGATALDAVRDTLRTRAIELGFVMTQDPAPSLRVDGCDIVPEPAPAIGHETVWQFKMPHNARRMNLRSRIGYGENDPPETFGLYPLGLKLSRILLRAAGQTTELDLADDSLFRACYAAEHWNEQALRWTSGEAEIELPEGAIDSVEVHIAATPGFWTRDA